MAASQGDAGGAEPTGAQALRVVVTGASGNLGTSLLRALVADPGVASVTGLARRVPDRRPPKTDWQRADLGSPGAVARLTELFRGADAVVHLAWLIQPSRDPVTTWRTNALGTDRVLQAVAAAQVPTVAVASSVAAYSPRPPQDDVPVDESWPTHGWPTASYPREKAYVERLLDVFEDRNPATRVVRMRPSFVFQRESAMAQRRLFAGPLVPHRLVRPGLLPVLPDVTGLRFQAVHGDDVADAFVRALHRPVRGAFNLAGEGPLDGRRLAELFDARPLPVPRAAARSAVAAAYRLRLVPSSPTLFDTLTRLPLLDTARARRDLGWAPRFTGAEALAEMLTGLLAGAGGDTPALRARTPGGRLREVASGVGRTP